MENALDQRDPPWSQPSEGQGVQSSKFPGTGWSQMSSIMPGAPHDSVGVGEDMLSASDKTILRKET